MKLRIYLLFLACIPLYVYAESTFLSSTTTSSTSKKEVRSAAHFHDNNGFANRINQYVEAIRQQVKVHAMTQELALEELLDLVKTNQRMHFFSFQEITDYLISISQLCARLQSQVDSQEFESVRCALLLQMVVPIDQQIRQLIFTLLEKIQRYGAYWQEQQDHQLYYFFHKSPAKWFIGSSQQEEIEEKINLLRELQTTFFEFLGNWSIKINSFNPQNATNQQYNWLVELISIPYQIIRGQQLSVEHLSHFDKLMPVMKELCIKLERFHEKTRTSLQKVAIPNVIIRNWVFCATSSLMLSYATYITYGKRAQIPQLIKDVRSTLYERFLKAPFDALCEAFPFLNPVLRRSSVAPELRDKKKTIKKLIAEFKDALNVTLLHMQGNKEKLTDTELRERYKSTVNNYLAYRVSQKMAPFTYNEKDIHDNLIVQSAINLDRGFILRCLNQCLSKDLPSSQGMFAYKNMLDLFPHGISLLDIALQIADNGIEKVKGDALTVVQPAFNNILDEMACTLEDFIAQLKKIVEQNQVNFALLTCIPTGAVLSSLGFGTKKIYQWYTFTNYDSIRSVLIAIAHLLNWYDDVEPHSMEPAHYGQLLYLGYRLKKEKFKMPQSLRVEFMRDVHYLEGPLSAEKKLRIIDLMYRTYPFLSEAKTN